MTTYLSRSAWTTSSVGGSTLTGLSLVGVAVHWPGTTQAAIGVQSQSATAARIKGYRDFHVNSRGWADIGYNFAIDQAGRVWQCRTTSWAGNRVGAHCASPTNPNANHKYVGVLLILGQSEQPSTAMVEAFRDWYHTRFLPVWKGRTDVRGHGQVPGAQTNCPGTRAKAKIADGSLEQKPGDTTPPQEDDMPLNSDDLAKIRKVVQDELARDYVHNGPPKTQVSTRHGGRYSFLALRQAGYANARAQAIQEAIAALPGVDGDALAAKVAAEVERLDAEAVAEQLEIDVKD